MELEELKVYNRAMELAENIWSIVNRWDYFQKDTIGKQLVRSADSIGANLSEGSGRYHFKESKNFGYYSRGSLYETKTWLTKAHQRKLINSEEYDKLNTSIEILGKMLNSYIKSVGGVNEPSEGYNSSEESPTNDQ